MLISILESISNISKNTMIHCLRSFTQMEAISRSLLIVSQPRKKSISINGVERKFLFYLQKPEKTFNLDIKFSNQFEVIKVKDASGNTFSPKNYKKTDKKITYPLELGKNLKDGLNQYTIE